MTGYSGTTLGKKLGSKPAAALFVSGAPENYMQLVSPLPAGVHLVRRLGSETDIVHIFATKRARLNEALRRSLDKMKPDAAIWVSWPKKAAKVPTDITEDTIRELALPMGLVDIKLCAVDDTWSALKLVLRKEKRKSR
jgi:hypothetical protein